MKPFVWAILLLFALGLGGVAGVFYQQSKLAGAGLGTIEERYDVDLSVCEDPATSTVSPSCVNDILQQKAIREMDPVYCAGMMPEVLTAGCEARVQALQELPETVSCRDFTEPLCGELLRVLLASNQKQADICQKIESESVRTLCLSYAGAEAVSDLSKRAARLVFGATCDRQEPACTNQVKITAEAVLAGNAVGCQALAQGAPRSLCEYEVAFYPVLSSGSSQGCATFADPLACQTDFATSRALAAQDASLCSAIEDSLKKEGCESLVSGVSGERFDYLEFAS